MHIRRGPQMHTYTYQWEGERLRFEQFCVCAKRIIHKNLSMEDLIKSLSSVYLPVCLSVHQFGVFLRNCSIVFSDFWHNDR